jgi:hypothetical protein
MWELAYTIAWGDLGDRDGHMLSGNGLLVNLESSWDWLA